jgi:hypothetical protein
MQLSLIFNFCGLLLITVGSILAALGTPSPQYNPDGSVTLSGIQDKEKRIKMYRRQKAFPKFLLMVALGAALQAVALFV